ncbi:MAG: SHOCT domain-containing protein [Chloroflexi bacterium]|nr:MAG: SHOCT domain-containing protein [Chloroflexota bacterium]TMF51861.1 MAG: SHOCT domain-containing protein [Chloroflexota bacterium]TMG17496.1 MAG: SHOCT domain-containing protein [Chloroflexota bacterium]TMG17563.1 MAG: SHOCT domain-containing protein [Chloroflexota bacterium]TMG50433.1 MAG: SHOCT domain-containing protein [Chloroflexota bacterium]
MGSPGARKATTVTIRFLDDEIMEGRVASVSLNQPNIELEMPDEASNNERALIPLPSIKRITLTAGEPSSEERARAERKVAIRFQDGEVLKGYLDGELRQASHGLTLRLLSVEKDRIETLGIPYTALKALFYLKTWDTRPPEFDGKEDRHLNKRLSSPLVDLISDMGQLDKLRKRGAITESEFQRKRRKILDNI